MHALCINGERVASKERVHQNFADNLLDFYHVTSGPYTPYTVVILTSNTVTDRTIRTVISVKFSRYATVRARIRADRNRKLRYAAEPYPRTHPWLGEHG